MDQSLTKQLLFDIEQKVITANDRTRAAWHVLDWIGCASLGKDSLAGKVYTSLVARAPDGSATVMLGKQAYWQDALQHNAAIGNVLEMDDIHRSSILHPGPIVIPAALAIAEQVNASMNAFLDAVILGYEITIRVGHSIGRSHYQYFHNTATCAGFGAALAAATLLKLTNAQTLSALGNVGSRTGGLWQMRNEKVQTKQWHNAEAARAGAMSAWLAQFDLAGPEFILEGPQGVFNAMSQDANPEVFLAQHDQWLMYDCSFKPWPACRHAHPAIDAFMTCIKSDKAGTELSRLDLNSIESISIYTYKDAMVFCDRPNPTTVLEAKFSIQYAIAAIALWGKPALSHYDIESDVISADDMKAIRNVISKISLTVCDIKEANYPAHYGARCEVVFVSGESSNKTILTADLQDTLGDPERPLPNTLLKEKAKMLLTESSMSADNMEALLSMDWASCDSLSALTALLQESDQ